MLAVVAASMAAVALAAPPLRIPIENCTRLTPRAPPDNVRNLQFRDVKVVMGMGDSITAGFALGGVPVDHKSKSYCCGDGEGQTTLGNFFHALNGGGVIRDEKFNAAIVGDVVQGMQSQAETLIKRLEEDPRIDMRNDWKVLTIWIGANNECPSCSGAERDTPGVYQRDLEQALETLHRGVPRLFINLVAMLNLTSLATAPGVNQHCRLQHELLTRGECPCAFGTPSEARMMNDIVQQNNQRLFVLQALWRLRGVKDFAVVVQPPLSGMTIPDHTYLSTFDCFHPSLKAHEQIAIGLWNSMLTPLRSKPHKLQPPVPIQCPNDTSVIWS